MRANLSDADATPALEASEVSPARSGADLRIWILAAVMGLASFGLLVSISGLDLRVAAPPRVWWVVVPLFAITEVYAIHLPTLRNAHTHTVREVPAVVGLVFLSAPFYFAAYLIGSACGLLFRKQKGVKLVFNLCMFALESSLGMLAFRTVLHGSDALSHRGWIASFVAIICTDCVSAVAVTTAISVSEKRFDAEVLKDAAGFGFIAAITNTCMALLCVVVAEDEPAALPFLGVAIVILAIAYRSFISLERGYARLQLLYRFVGKASRSVDTDEAIRLVLSEARELLGANRASIIILPSPQEAGIRVTSQPGSDIEVEAFSEPDADRDAWWAPAALGQPVLRENRSKNSSHRERSSGGPRDGLAVPLSGDDRVEAVLLVMERAFERQTFSTEDLRLFQTLAGHAAVELDKSRLVDRLRKLATQREHEARQDPLTGLPNRRAFQEALDAADTRRGAVLLLDLNDFKDVNDTLGHGAGDRLLCETGERIRRVTGGMVARLGGDEFAVLLLDVDRDLAQRHALRVLEAISEPVVLHEVNLFIGGSIGVALLPEHGSGIDELLQHADVAMYTAKNAGSGVEIYRTDDALISQRRLVLAGDISTALDRGEFEVWYQPQAWASDRTIAGMEALLRWHHPAYGSVPPEEVIALAARTGLLRRLTNTILRQALIQRAAWARHGHDLTVSVNLTPGDLCDHELPGIVAEMLASTRTRPEALTLEIVESDVMTDPARCMAVLTVLAGMGVRLSVDDFGTGHSSLAYLERLPVNEVKIDRSFVARLEREATDAKVIKATIALAHDLGMHVVAEGVETDHGWAAIAELGAEFIQGYALARPMPPDAALVWLRGLTAAPRALALA